MDVIIDKRNYPDLAQLKGQLWIAGIKIRGIGHLIKYQNAESTPEHEETAGIGEILCGIGEEIGEICDHLNSSLAQ